MDDHEPFDDHDDHEPFYNQDDDDEEDWELMGTQKLTTKKGKKRGPKTGTKHTNQKDMNDWFQACQGYNGTDNHKEYLRLLPKFSGTHSEAVSFGKKLKQYKEGKLKPSESKKMRPSHFPNIEEKLVAYIDLRAKFYKRDKCGLSWQLLKIKAQKFADDLGMNDFKASDGWLNRTLKRSGKIGISLHGEADDMVPEERFRIVEEWKGTKFHPLIEKYSVLPECIYNADQTGFFYQKLPNRLYVDKANKRDYAGAKQMKDKNRITVMVCTAANGSKVPLFVVGKYKNPTCFRLCENDKPPMAYLHQKNAWFDKRVTLWWLNNVFIPSHWQKWGDTHCILILDNCTAHKIDEALLPTWLHLIFLPPNMTSNFQPADMGMIASLKIGYKAIMLRKLLDIFDAEGGFDGASTIRRTVMRGQRGLDYGGKATILDAMYILNSVWKEDHCYAKEDGIRRCWRKAGILPIDMNTAIDSELGSASMTIANKTLSKNDCDQLCELMVQLKVKASAALLDCNNTAIAFQGSFVAETDQFTPEEYNNMIENWINIEDEEEVINAICEEEIEMLESSAELPADDDAGDDNEPDVQPDEFDSDDIVSYVEALEMLRKLQVSASSLLGDDQKARCHLDRFLKSLHGANAKKTRKDTTLHAYFGKK
jgi:hypothetical protein